MAPHSLDVNIVEQILEDLPPALLALVIPGTLLYLSLYAFAKRWTWGFRMVSVLTLLGFWISESAAPVRCAGLRAQLNFAGMHNSFPSADYTLLVTLRFISRVCIIFSTQYPIARSI